MFELLRKMIAPLMMIVLVAFVATIIFSWGGGGFGGRPENVVGVVDGENVTLQEFENFYQNLVRQERVNTPDQDISSERSRQLRDQAWNQLVADKLMNKQVKDKGTYVTKKEVFDYIAYYPPASLQSAPQFMTDGKFDYQKYVNAMPVPENAPFWASVEAMVTPDLLKRKVIDDLYNSVRVTPSEVTEEFLLTREQIKIGYINVASNMFRSEVATPTDDECKEFYEGNKSKFEVDERAVIDLVKFDKTPSENDWTSRKYEIQGFLDSILVGADFAEMAEVFSEDGSAANGGDLGWFGRGRMVGPFDSAVFTMNIGDVSKPVKTQFGWHLIKLIDKKTDPKDGEQCLASHILLRVNPSQETLQNIYDNAQNLADSARTMGGLGKAAELFNYEITQTGKFFNNSFINPELQRHADVLSFTFENKVGSISDPYENDKAVFVVSVAERLPEGHTPFEEAKGQIEGELKTQASLKMAVDSAQVIYDDIMSGLAPSQIEAKYGFAYSRTNYMTRSSGLQEIGDNQKVIGAAFALGELNQFSKPIEYDRGAVLLTLLDRQSPNLTEFSEVQDSIYSIVITEKQNDAYRRWFDNLVKNAKVEKMVDQFYGSGY